MRTQYFFEFSTIYCVNIRWILDCLGEGLIISLFPVSIMIKCANVHSFMIIKDHKHSRMIHIFSLISWWRHNYVIILMPRQPNCSKNRTKLGEPKTKIYRELVDLFFIFFRFILCVIDCFLATIKNVIKIMYDEIIMTPYFHERCRKHFFPQYLTLI